MNVFLSYPSEKRLIAERISLSLRAEGHEVFFDRTSLETGEAFDARIRQAIRDCDLFVFLITPDSVAPGSYCLSELRLANERWPHPKGKMLPVMLADTPFDAIPPYAKAVNILSLSGDPAAEIGAELEKLVTGKKARIRWWLGTGLVGSVALGILMLWLSYRSRDSNIPPSLPNTNQVDLDADPKGQEEGRERSVGNSSESHSTPVGGQGGKTPDLEGKEQASISGGGLTSLLRYPEIVYDTKSRLVWARDIFLFGTTEVLFARSRDGQVALQHDLDALDSKMTKLILRGVSGWRLASSNDLETLKPLSGGTLFSTFKPHRIQTGATNLIGVYRSGTGKLKSWGYQHANYLQGPYDEGVYERNEYGVWVVAGPNDLQTQVGNEKPQAVHSVTEGQIEVKLNPLLKVIFQKRGSKIISDWKTVTAGMVGNLDPDETRCFFEYDLGALERGGFVRAEISLEAMQTSGDVMVMLLFPPGDGVVSEDDWEPSTPGESVSWDPHFRSRIELPAHLIRNIYNSRDKVDVHFRYAGKKGDVKFKVPEMIVTFVPTKSLLVQN